MYVKQIQLCHSSRPRVRLRAFTLCADDFYCHFFKVLLEILIGMGDAKLF